MDTVTHALRRLQDEKQNLEKQLLEKTNRKNELEEMLGDTNLRHKQARDAYYKKMDEHKKAMHLVRAAQDEAIREAKQYEIQRRRIDNNEKIINAEKENRNARKEEFVAKLEVLTKEFMDLREFYSKESLDEKIADAVEHCAELDAQVEAINSNIPHLLEEARKAGLKEMQDPYADTIPEETRKLIWLMLQEEQDFAYQQLAEAMEQLTVAWSARSGMS